MRRFFPSLAACVLVCLSAVTTSATANFVYHEQTANFVATPTCPSGGTDTSCGRYVENTDRSGAAGFQIYEPETYSLHSKIEFQFFTNQVRVYYTTDGTNPSGSFGTPFGTTQVATASYTCTYSDQTQGCQIVDVVTGAIPPQPAGTTVKYIVGAWHSGGGPEVFANSGTCTGCFSCTDATTGCATVFEYSVIAPPATPLIISELRYRGASGANDEFVEIYNNSDSDVTVNSFDGSAGFSVAASDGVTRFTIPNGTVIPARGHYLGVNSVSYSLAAYPAGNGTTATGDATYTTDIPDNVGVALFRTANPSNFSLANRLDAAGSSNEANTLYREGTGYPPLVTFNVNYSYYRDLQNAAGRPLDTNDNNNDFIFVDTQGTCALSVGGGCPSLDFTRRGRHLGAPGPENLSSPIQRSGLMPLSLISPCVAASSSPNRVRDLTDDPSEPNDTFGTLDIRRRVTNSTGANVTRLRFRITDITTFPVPTGTADLRPLTSTSVVVSNPCTGLNVTVQGTTLEEPPTQGNGGGYNSSLSAGTITLATPLAPGATIDVRFRLGVQQTGHFRFFITVEVLP